DLSHKRAATGSTLTASATGFTAVTSTASDIIPGTATQLACTVQPSTRAAGAATSPGVQVTALDPAGNLVPSFTGSITVALGNNPGGSTLGEIGRASWGDGVASLAALTLAKTGTGYWATATAPGRIEETSLGWFISP